MDNKYVRGLIYVAAGVLILVGLLYIGDWIARSSSEEAWGIGPGQQAMFGSDGNILGGWLTWVIIGGILLYLIYVLFAESEMFRIGTREVVMMALGAALYGVLAWIFNIVPVPSVSLVALRPVVVIPIFFGFVFGPAVGFFVGAFGNILGDALTGWGVFPIWDFANGLMGFIPGLAGMYLRQRRGNLNLLLYISAAILALGVILPLVAPNITDPFSGEPANFGAWWYIMLVVLVIVLGTALAPSYWPILLGLLTLAFVVFGVLQIVNPPEGVTNPIVGSIVLWVFALIFAVLAFFVYRRTAQITTWLDAEDTRALTVWGTLGVIVGIGFAAMADIFYNGYSFTTAFIGEFIPAAGPNILFAVILTPLLYAAWKQTRTQMGR